eukprot:XP_001699368.1 predicted protein [Chlamydomonas reinhardtii]
MVGVASLAAMSYLELVAASDTGLGAAAAAANRSSSVPQLIPRWLQATGANSTSGTNATATNITSGSNSTETTIVTGGDTNSTNTTTSTNSTTPIPSPSPAAGNITATNTTHSNTTASGGTGTNSTSPPLSASPPLPPSPQPPSSPLISTLGGLPLDGTATQLLSNVTTVRLLLSRLYGTLNVSLAPYGVDALALQPLALLRSGLRAERQLGVAVLAADAQLGSVVGLGAALLRAAGGVSTAGNSSRLAALVAAQLVHQLALHEDAAAKMKAMATNRTGISSMNGNSSDTVQPSPSLSPSPLPPSPLPPSPPLPPGSSADLVGPAAVFTPLPYMPGLYSTVLVREVYITAAARAGVPLTSAAVNATVAVAASVAAYAEVVKQVALAELRGVVMGLNPLNAAMGLARLAVVQAEAEGVVGQVVSGANAAALDTYVLDALPERISKAAVDVAAVHSSLGLAVPAAAVAAVGVAHLVGPLRGCSGQANDLWTPAYEAFTTGSAGGISMRRKGLGSVTVSPYRLCYDALTQLPLNLSVSNLSPSMGIASVSPVAMLAQGLYTVQATQQLMTVTAAQQDAAFAAMGLDRAAYNALMVAAANASAASASNSSSSSSSTSSSTSSRALSSQGFLLNQPLMGAVLAANAQLLGLFYAARAMFTSSCYYTYGLDSWENAHTFTVTLTLYAAAQQALASGSGKLDLSSPTTLNSMWAMLVDACDFNSAQLLVSPSPPPPPSTADPGSALANVSGAAGSSGPTITPTGTLLAGGDGTAVGAATTSTAALTGITTVLGHRRQLLTSRQRTELLLGGDGDGGSSAWSEVVSAGWQQGALDAEGVLRHAEGSPATAAAVALHRRLRAHLLADLGLVGLEALLPEGSPARRHLLQQPRNGGERADEPRTVRGDLLGQAATAVATATGPGTGGRRLSVYADDPDMGNVYTKVSEILSGINAQLRSIQAQSADAALLPGAAASLYNLTGLVLNATQLGHVAQYGLYNRLVAVLRLRYSDGLSLVTALQKVAADYTGSSLALRMTEAAVAVDTVCSEPGSQCSVYISNGGVGYSPPPSQSGAGSSSSSSSNMGAVIGIAVGCALGGLALLVGGFMAYKYVRRRQIKQTVVNTFKTGDQGGLNLRVASTLHGNGFSPLNNAGLGTGALAPLRPGGEAYSSTVPAALGHNPAVAHDYPLYPTPSYGAAAYGSPAGPGGEVMMTPAGAGGAQYLHHGGAAGAMGPGAAGAGGMASARGEAGLVDRNSPAGGPGAALLGATSGYKTYPNSAYVPDQRTAAADSTALRDTGLPSPRHQAAQPYPYPYSYLDTAGGTASPRAYRPTTSSSAPPQMLAPTLSAPVTPTHANAANTNLNGTTGRRGGQLPPLAAYTSVQNPAAPTSSLALSGGLNSSIRAIPVNSNFNSSLRPPTASAHNSDGGSGGHNSGPNSYVALRSPALAGTGVAASGQLHGPSTLGPSSGVNARRSWGPGQDYAIASGLRESSFYTPQ